MRSSTRLAAAAAAVVAAVGLVLWGIGGSGRDRDGEPSAGADARASVDWTEIELVVLVVIDQLPSWSFEKARPLLTGGIDRLLREGAYIPRAEFPYASTYTAPGHAALGTGAPPSRSGVLANAWYRRELGRSRAATADEASPILAVGDRRPSPGGASPRQLAVPGVADALREATGGKGRSIAIGIKPRAAIFASGRRPDLAVFYDPEQRAMTTSAYYADAAPDWLVRLHEDSPLSERFDAVWEPLDADQLDDVTGRPDAAPGEGAIPGYFGDAFPHDLGASMAPAKAVRNTPSAAAHTVRTARAAVAAEDLGRGGPADFLALSFSSHDYAGHFWGQESWERLDLFLRIDRLLGELLADLDAHVGPGAYAVVLASDHGAAPLVEEGASEGAARVSPEEVADAADRAVASVLGPGEYFEIRSASTLYLRGLEDAPPGARDRALDAAARAVRDVPGVGYAARTDRLRGDCDAMEGTDALACRSLGDGLGEIVHFPAARSLITGFPSGTTHGTPHAYDRRVPLVIRAPGWRPGTRSERVSILRVAPTLAALLGAELGPHAPPPLEPRAR